MDAPPLSLLNRWRLTVASASLIKFRSFVDQAERERGRIPHESVAKMRAHFWSRFAWREISRCELDRAQSAFAGSAVAS